MGASTHTTELVLPIFSDTDKPTWRGDMNDAMQKIDDAVGGIRNAYYRSVTWHDHADPTGVADATAAIVAGIAACDAAGGGTLFLKKGDYKISALITVPQHVRLLGEGGRHAGVLNAATRIFASNAAAGLQFKGAGCGMEEIQFDGANLSTAGLTVGGTVAGDRGAFPLFKSVSVIQCATDGWKIYGSQNGLIQRCQSLNNGGNGVIMDYSPGGWTFEGFEFGGNQGVQLLGLNTAAGALFQNTWIGCLFEYGTTDNPRVRITAGSNWRFYSCNFASQLIIPAVQPIIDIAQGQHLFDSSTITLQGGQTAFKCGNGVVVTFDGQNAMSGFGAVDTFWFDGSAGARAVFNCEYPTNTLTTNGKLITAGTTQSQVGKVTAGYNQIIRTNATFLADYLTTLGDAFNKSERYMNGVITWGSGAAATDVQIGRLAAGVVEVSGGGTVGGVIQGVIRHRQSLVGASGAAQTLKEIGLFSQQVITLSGAAPCVLTAPTYNDGAEFLLIIGNNGSATITWPASFKWPGNVAPTLSGNGKIDIFRFRCSLNFFYGEIVGQNYG